MSLASILVLPLGIPWAWHQKSALLVLFVISICASVLLFGMFAVNARRYYLEALWAYDEGAKQAGRAARGKS